MPATTAAPAGTFGQKAPVQCTVVSSHARFYWTQEDLLRGSSTGKSATFYVQRSIQFALCWLFRSDVCAGCPEVMSQRDTKEGWHFSPFSTPTSNLPDWLRCSKQGFTHTRVRIFLFSRTQGGEFSELAEDKSSAWT